MPCPAAQRDLYERVAKGRLVAMHAQLAPDGTGRMRLSPICARTPSSDSSQTSANAFQCLAATGNDGLVVTTRNHSIGTTGSGGERQGPSLARAPELSGVAHCPARCRLAR